MIDVNVPSGGNDTQGINLLTGTKDFSGEWFFFKDDCVREGTYKGLDIYKHNQQWSGVTQRIDVLEGETYTFSAYVKADSSVAFVLSADLIDFARTNPASMSFDATTDWKRYAFSFKVTCSGKLNPRVQMPTSGVNLYVCGYKLERGTVTDPVWTPAPEDIATHTDVEQAVAGENLLRCVNESLVLGSGEWASRSWREASGGTGTRTQIDITDCPNPLIKKGWRFTSTSGTVNIAQNSIPIKYGKTYTLSCYGRGTGTLDIHLGNSEYRSKLCTPLTDWQKYEFSYTFTENDKAALNSVTNIYFGSEKVSDNIEICGMKFEENAVADPVFTLPPVDYIFHAFDPIPEMHRNIYRGKNLGTSFTTEQKANIKNGTFHDLWLGDYWTINNHTWRIVDINYWYNKGDQNCTTPHIVVMPDAILYSHKMNNDNVTTGGYYGSLMYTEGLTQAKEIVNTDFGEGFVLNHRVLLTNKVDSGHASAGTWYDSTVELANEIMIYGCLVLSAMNNGTAVPYLCTTESTQLALFRLVPRFINISRQWYWLRDVVSATTFASVDINGRTSYTAASLVGGVRPVVGITGETATTDEPDSDLEMTELSTKGDSSASDLETSLSTKGGDPL